MSGEFKDRTVSTVDWEDNRDILLRKWRAEGYEYVEGSAHDSGDPQQYTTIGRLRRIEAAS